MENPLIEWLKGHNDDNLHLIAISNLQSHERRMKRWWMRKYKKPLKEYEDHTSEELLIEMLEDYYEKHPEQAERFLDGLHSKSLDDSSADEDWDGSMPEDYEQQIKGFLSKQKTNLEKYRSDSELSEEQEKALIDNLGKNLPLSKARPKKEGVPLLGADDEFDETFEV